MKLTKYQEYQLKFYKKVSDITIKHHGNINYMPKLLEEKDFYTEYNRIKITYKLFKPGDTNYLRGIISKQWKEARQDVSSEKRANAILKWQEDRIKQMMSEDGISRSKAIRIMKANNDYITTSDIKYVTDVYKRRLDEIKNYGDFLKSQGMTSYEIAESIGQIYFGSP